MIARIDKALVKLPKSDFSYAPLDYIRRSLTPEAIAARDEWDQGVSHLHEVANERLRPLEKEVRTA